MEESRQASVELMGTAYHTGCGIQHSLQFVGRRTCQDCVAVVNMRRDERMWPQILCQVNDGQIVLFILLLSYQQPAVPAVYVSLYLLVTMKT